MLGDDSLDSGTDFSSNNFYCIQSQRKNPAFAIPSTIIIIPAIKMIVAQLIPAVLSSAHHGDVVEAVK